MVQGVVPGPGRKVVVGSGLDRPKLEQMKRLCRRLRAEARTAVDPHTTHIIVQVIALPIHSHDQDTLSPFACTMAEVPECLSTRVARANQKRA